jgi:hypothetical protein
MNSEFDRARSLILEVLLQIKKYYAVFNKYNVIPELFIVTGAQFQFHEMSNKSDYALYLRNWLSSICLIPCNCSLQF